MNGSAPSTAPSATHAAAVIISQRPTGCGDCWMRKYPAASSSASPSRNGHLGTVQYFESFTLPVSEKSVVGASKGVAWQRSDAPARRRRSQAASLSARLMARNENHASMPTCVIFNPAARGDKARHFRRHLDEIGGQSALKATVAPGDARRLAAEAVGDGYDLIVAAGGDGTVNEVLNGLGDAPEGFAPARLVTGRGGIGRASG